MNTEESTLDKIRSRPRFKLYTQLSKEEVARDLQYCLDKNSDRFYGNVNSEVATIQVRTEIDNYWKPNLALRIEKEDERTVIRGIFGPHSSIWTLFMFLYFLFSVLWMTFITMFFVERQINSHEFPWALPASFVMLAGMGLTYFASRVGQKKAKSEMKLLRQFAEKTVLGFEEQETINPPAQD